MSRRVYAFRGASGVSVSLGGAVMITKGPDSLRRDFLTSSSVNFPSRHGIQSDGAPVLVSIRPRMETGDSESCSIVRGRTAKRVHRKIMTAMSRSWGPSMPWPARSCAILFKASEYMYSRPDATLWTAVKRSSSVDGVLSESSCARN